MFEVCWVPKQSWGLNYEVVKWFRLSQHSAEVKPEVFSWGQPLWKKILDETKLFWMLFFCLLTIERLPENQLPPQLKSEFLDSEVSPMVQSLLTWQKPNFLRKKSDFINFTGQEQDRDYRLLHSGWLWNDTPKKNDVPTQLNRENRSKSWVVICWVLIPIWLPVWFLLNFLLQFVHHL